MWVWFMVNNLLEHYGVDDLIEVHGSAGHGVWGINGVFSGQRSGKSRDLNSKKDLSFC